MNRKRKLNAILNSKLKKKNAKLSKVVKPKYVSKAERERLALLALEEKTGVKADAQADQQAPE